MKIKLHIILILSFVLSGHSQNKVVDSLNLRLNLVNNGLDKVRLLNTISEQYKYTDPEKMVDYGNQALELAKRGSYRIEEGKAYINLGTANIIYGNYAKSLEQFSVAKSIFESENESDKKATEFKESLAQLYAMMGVVFSEQSNYTRALLFYLKSVKIYEALENDVKSSRLYNNIGVVYRSQNLSDDALEYFEKSRQIQSRLDDPNIGITLTNMANIYQKDGKYDEAFKLYQEAKFNLDKYPNPRALGEWYNNIGLYYKSQGNNVKAIGSWNKAITTFEGFDDKFGLSDTYLYLGQFYFEQEDLQNAKQYAQKALGLAKDINIRETQSITEKLLSDIYVQQGKTNLAFEHFKAYSVIKDSLVNEQNIRKSVKATLNYEFEKKEILHKEEAKKQSLLVAEEAKSTKMKWIFASLTIILLFGIGLLINNRNELKKRLTLEKELAEYEQKALHLQMNPHFVFNCLGSISSFIVQNGTESAIKYLSKFSKLMRLTLEYSKESLIPIDKEIESLKNYLELEQLRFNHMFSFSINKSSDIDDDVSLPPLLIQPCVENAIIHGVIPKKTIGSIAITFSITDNQLVCTITDDGIGIDTSKKNKENSVRAHKSMALEIIKKRLEMIASSTSKNATINVVELRDQNNVNGTKVELKLPLQYISVKTPVSL